MLGSMHCILHSLSYCFDHALHPCLELYPHISLVSLREFSTGFYEDNRKNTSDSCFSGSIKPLYEDRFVFLYMLDLGFDILGFSKKHVPCCFSFMSVLFFSKKKKGGGVPRGVDA
jgi:hypothetical protein